MIKIQGKLGRQVYVACSGGVDSMAIVDFLKRNHVVNVLFFDHGTETSREAKVFLESTFNDDPKVNLQFGSINRDKYKRESQEEYWRNQRYEWFHSFDIPVITCHHLDDCAETWIWSSLHGNGKIIPYQNCNVIRPFRLNRKSEFVAWCERKNVKWVEDKSNHDTKYMRNFIRHEMMEKVLFVNPGLHKVIYRKIETDEISCDFNSTIDI